MKQNTASKMNSNSFSPSAEEARLSENVKIGLYQLYQLVSRAKFNISSHKCDQRRAFDGKSNPLIGLKLFSSTRLNILQDLRIALQYCNSIFGKPLGFS